MSLILPLPPLTHPLFLFPKSIPIWTILKELFVAKKHLIMSFCTPPILFSICLRLSAAFCHSFTFCIHPSLLSLSPWVTCSLCQCRPHHPFSFCSCSASPSPLSIIHLGYNRSIISNNTSVAPRGETEELCWALTHSEQQTTPAAGGATKLGGHEMWRKYPCYWKCWQSVASVMMLTWGETDFYLLNVLHGLFFCIEFLQ